VIQMPETSADGMTLVTLLCHKAGGVIRTELTMKPAQNTPQAIGSTITYARRYSLMAIAGVAADDDDGTAGSLSAKTVKVTDADRSDAADWIECMDQCQSVDELAAYFKTIWDDVKVKPTEIMNLVVAAKDAAKKKLAGGQ
jgi:hypothetical protein